MSIRESRPRSGRKADVVTKIQLERLHQGQSMEEATNDTAQLRRMKEPELRQLLKETLNQRTNGDQEA